MTQKNSSQMLKGILSGSILILLAEESLYGYTLSEKLVDFGFAEIPKGTIYPLLLTLEKKGLIEGRMEASPDGPQRKYYFLTEAGEKEKASFIQQWRQLKNNVDALIERDEKNED
ncbi:transcriptional regulator [Enterococcus saigonensis]|uniref:Transcriptional regulator n=1 Tax=Enterococcus saigonensis TaxID=1805431 RepID=A0A679IF47_9ENTE|nr:PadR family transcriptional regulator [Enterococcus saigonensis]BCA86940.1 transcriptional regulator [Enterococcus saigonensis]